VELEIAGITDNRGTRDDARVMEEPLLRPATPADVPELVETVRQGFETYREWAPRGWDPPETELHVAGVRARMAEPGCWCEVAEVGGQLVGQAGTVPARGAPHAAHIWMLFVRERWWGSGLAARLLERADAAARAAGRSELRLQTPSEHLRARAFYEREGFERRGDPLYEPMLGLVLISYRRRARAAP
jgi:GNAT superfamily N-acetyltransferase